MISTPLLPLQPLTGKSVDGAKNCRILNGSLSLFGRSSQMRRPVVLSLADYWDIRHNRFFPFLLAQLITVARARNNPYRIPNPLRFQPPVKTVAF